MNNNRNLTSYEIQGLYYYIEIQNIPYKDVQHEIVDHIATELEMIPLENKSDSFSKHLYNYLDTLPKDFFQNFLKEKTKSLSKLWRRRFIEGFSFKLIISSLILGLISHSIISQVILLGFVIPKLSIFIIIQSIMTFSTLYFSHKKIRSENNEINLSILQYTGVTTILFTLIVNTLLLLTIVSYSLDTSYFSITILCFLFCSIYIIAFDLPQQLEEDLKLN